MSSKMLYEAIALIRAAKLDEARRMIFDIIRNEPTNEMAWMWLAETLSSDQDRMKVLLACQMENPNSRITRMAIDKLQEKIDAEAEKESSAIPFKNGETFDPNMPERTGHTGAIIGFDGSFIVSEVADFDDVVDLRQEEEQLEKEESAVAAFSGGLEKSEVSEKTPSEQAFLSDEEEKFPLEETDFLHYQEEAQSEELEFEPDLSGLFQDETIEIGDKQQPFDFDDSLSFEEGEDDEADRLARLFTEADQLEPGQSSDEELTAYDLGFLEDSATELTGSKDLSEEDTGQVKTIHEEDLVEDKVIKSGVEEFERNRKKKDRNLIILVVGLFILISALCVVAVYVILNYSKFSNRTPLPTSTQMVVAAPVEEEIIPTATLEPTATEIPEPTATATTVPTATPLVAISDRAIKPDNVNSLQLRIQEEFGVIFVKSLDGNRVALVDGEIITIRNPMDGSQLFELADHTADVVDVAFSDDGQHLVSAAEDFSVYLWNVRTGELAGRFVFDGESINRIRAEVGSRFPVDISVDYSPDETTIAAGAFGVINIFDVATKSTRGVYAVETEKLQTIVADVEELQGFDVKFNQNGWVLSAAMSGHLVGVDSLDATPLYQIDLTPLASIQYADDRLRMLESDIGGVLLRGIETGEAYNGFDGVEEKPDQSAPIVGLSEKWDVIGIESANTENNVQLSVWQVDEDEFIGDFPAVCEEETCRNPVFAISPKGDWIAVEQFVDNTTSVQLYDLTTKKEIQQLTNFSSAVQSIAISPTGEVIAVLSQNGVLRVWDVDYGAQRVSLEADNMEKIEFSKDGRYLFGWNSESVLVWSLP